MSAETLRKAAEKLRGQANAAHTHPLDLPWVAERVAVTTVFTGRDEAVFEDDCATLEDASYISTMHPGVGLALADWLEDEAHRADYREGQQHQMNVTRLRPEPFPAYYDASTVKAIAVARLILGGAS